MKANLLIIFSWLINFSWRNYTRKLCCPTHQVIRTMIEGSGLLGPAESQKATRANLETIKNGEQLINNMPDWILSDLQPFIFKIFMFWITYFLKLIPEVLKLWYWWNVWIKHNRNSVVVENINYDAAISEQRWKYKAGAHSYLLTLIEAKRRAAFERMKQQRRASGPNIALFIELRRLQHRGLSSVIEGWRNWSDTMMS